jgi:hypothetical protein
VVLAGLVSGAIFLALSFLLTGIIASSTVRLSDTALFWTRVLLGGFGLVAGLAVEAVRQLQEANPDPAYRQRGGLSGRSRR